MDSDRHGMGWMLPNILQIHDTYLADYLLILPILPRLQQFPACESATAKTTGMA